MFLVAGRFFIIVCPPLETLLAHSAKLQDQQSWPVSVLQPSPATHKGHLILKMEHDTHTVEYVGAEGLYASSPINKYQWIPVQIFWKVPKLEWKDSQNPRKNLCITHKNPQTFPTFTP